MNDASEFIFMVLNVRLLEGLESHSCISYQHLANVSQISQKAGRQDHQG